MDLYTFGEAMAVLVADPGVPLAQAQTFRRTVAGSEINVACGLSRLGRSVAFASRVGADAFGDVVLRTLRSDGVDTSSVVVDPDAPTGLLVRDAHCERAVQVAYYRAGSAASRLHADDVVRREPARILYATGITPLLSDGCAAATHAALEAARATGSTVAYDPNLRRRLLNGREPAVLQEFSAYSDLILTGEDEGFAITGTTDVRGMADSFLDAGARLVLVKQGRSGAWATDGKREWSHRPEPAHVLDPVGAGDAFNVGFLDVVLAAGDLGEVDVDEALAQGSLCGRLAVQVVGDIEGLPTRRELVALGTGLGARSGEVVR